MAAIVIPSGVVGIKLSTMLRKGSHGGHGGISVIVRKRLRFSKVVIVTPFLRLYPFTVTLDITALIIDFFVSSFFLSSSLTLLLLPQSKARVLTNECLPGGECGW